MLSDTGQALVYAARADEPSTYRVEQSAGQDIERAVEAILAPPDAEGASPDEETEDSES